MDFSCVPFTILPQHVACRTAFRFELSMPLHSSKAYSDAGRQSDGSEQSDGMGAQVDRTSEGEGDATIPQYGCESTECSGYSTIPWSDR